MDKRSFQRAETSACPFRKRRLPMTLGLSSAIVICAGAAACLQAADLRLGLIGTDTSHVTEFAKTLNDPAAKDHIGGARIVVAYKGGSPDVEDSSRRVERFASELREKYGIPRSEEHTSELQ